MEAQRAHGALDPGRLRRALLSAHAGSARRTRRARSAATTMILARSLAPDLDELVLDLCDTLTIDSIRSARARSLTYTRQESSVDGGAGAVYGMERYAFDPRLLPRHALPVERIPILPLLQPAGRHYTVPTIATLSEPYGARDWWPSKNDPCRQGRQRADRDHRRRHADRDLERPAGGGDAAAAVLAHVHLVRALPDCDLSDLRQRHQLRALPRLVRLVRRRQSAARALPLSRAARPGADQLERAAGDAGVLRHACSGSTRSFSKSTGTRCSASAGRWSTSATPPTGATSPPVRTPTITSCCTRPRTSGSATR